MANSRGTSSDTPAGSATERRIEQAIGTLGRLAITRMEHTFPWYRTLSAEDRSWVGLVAQAGIAAFLAWFRQASDVRTLTADIFGTAPRELTRSISLRQTLDLVRTVVEVVEDQADELAATGDERLLREAILRYSREVAFSAAEVYAQAAESRGAWDARLEALIVDAVLRGEADNALRSRAAALGWGAHGNVAVVAGYASPGAAIEVVEAVRQQAHRSNVEALGAVQGGRLVTILGNIEADPLEVAGSLVRCFAPGPMVVGPLVPELFDAGRSARAALSGLVAARAWPDAPRPVLAHDLLPERVLTGDAAARRALIDLVYRPLVDAQGSLLETVTTYLDGGCSLEGSARLLFVHPNTVRYRLRRVTAVCGYDVQHPREAYIVRVALALGRLADGPHRPR
ncbi:MAG: PucR family transcriptional regulator [Actinomycetota bacterium]